MIDWSKATAAECELFARIVDREQREHVKCYADRMSAFMDIQAAHAACPIRLKDLLKAPRVDFLHDIYGIAENLDRSTGELANCFVPRYAVPQDTH